MRVVGTGKRFELYDDSLKTYNMLPPKAYSVRFAERSGFYLEEHAPIEIKEKKIYGVHTEKINKVLSAFKLMDRNLGVILSGNKGIGKSLFAKMLAVEAVRNGIPLIIVDKFIPGIANYIEEIEQEVMVLFDEFDKTFGGITTGDNQANPQAGLLSLFDGVAFGKKLFVITCNEMKDLNSFLINRPGRFHYHIRFDYPSDTEITEYLTDKLSPEYYGQINDVIAFSKKVSLNYDCLRSIAFEINTGLTFKDAIKDLNIINLREERYNITLRMTEGAAFKTQNISLDLFSPDNEYSYWLDDSTRETPIRVRFCVSDCRFDINKGMYIVKAEDLDISYDNEEDYVDGYISKIKAMTPEYLEVVRKSNREIHYMV